MKKIYFCIPLILLVFVFISSKSYSQTELRYNDKVRINEALKISEFVSDNIWKDWSKTPFIILLIGDSTEYLINHPNPSPDFSESYSDNFLNAKVYSRKRVFQKGFLATFPAVNGASCVVAGIPENTGKDNLDWVITLLHEHFHQYQNNYPGYFEGVDKLDLKNGDESGMWMLNYEFPYENKEVIAAFNDMKSKLNKAFLNNRLKKFTSSVSAYLKAKNKFKNLLSEKDFRYFDFQLWQEGIARYTEYKTLSYLVKNKYKFTDEFISITDKLNAGEQYKKIIVNLIKEFEGTQLENNKRVSFYSFGAMEGFVLDTYNKEWRNNYFKNMFSTTKLFKKK